MLSRFANLGSWSSFPSRFPFIFPAGGCSVCSAFFCCKWCPVPGTQVFPVQHKCTLYLVHNSTLYLVHKSTLYLVHDSTLYLVHKCTLYLVHRSTLPAPDSALQLVSPFLNLIVSCKTYLHDSDHPLPCAWFYSYYPSNFIHC